MKKIQSLNPITVFLLVASMPLAAASLDMFLPALPTMMKEFGTNESTIQISLSLNIIAGAALGFSSGILSDQFGRRRLFITALFIFAGATYSCSLATNVTFFTVTRTIQGAASGVIFVMVTAILSDVYDGVKKAQVLGIATFLFPIALGVAPFLGEKVYRHYGWPATFVSLTILLLIAAFVLFFMLPETRQQEATPMSLKKVLFDSKRILFTPAFMINALIPSVFMGAFMAFVAYSPFIYINYFGLTSKAYVYYFITPLVFQFVAGILYQGVVKLLGINKTLLLGLMTTSCALVIIVGLLIGWIPLTPVYVMSVMLFYNSSIPFILPTVMAKAFETFPTKAGTISSLASLIRNTFMSGYIYISGVTFNATPTPVFWVLASGIILFIILTLQSFKLSNSPTSTAQLS